MDRLKEIGMFFQKRSPQHQTMRRLARRLKKAGIPYAIMGAMAVNAHGAERTTKDIDILLTPEGLERFRQEFVGEAYEQVAGRPRRFVERQSGVTVDCLITGRYPGSGKPGPLRVPRSDRGQPGDRQDSRAHAATVDPIEIGGAALLRLRRRGIFDPDQQPRRLVPTAAAPVRPQGLHRVPGREAARGRIPRARGVTRLTLAAI